MKNQLTIEIKRLAKKGRSINGRLYLYVDRDPRAESYSDACFFKLTCSERKRYDIETKEVIEGIPGIVRNGHTSERHQVTHDGHTQWEFTDKVYRPDAGYWSLYACETFPNIVELLPNHASISFEIALDEGSSLICAAQQVHVDHLYLVAKWMKGKREIVRRFRIDSELSYHNTARFGTPAHDQDSKGRAA